MRDRQPFRTIASSFKIAGNVKAEVSGLVKKLADLGVIGTGETTSTNYEGVLQQQLADTLKDVRNCKLKTLEILKAQLLPAAQSDDLTAYLPSCGRVVGSRSSLGIPR
jgi:hypothetical protein